MNKEQNFISAVVYVQEDTPAVTDFFRGLYAALDERFAQFEIVAVNGAGAVNRAEALREWARDEAAKPVTVLTMSLRQPHEQCMNAGLDIAIGDYIYEFDSTEHPYDFSLLHKAYDTALQGSDIVTVCPSRVRGGSRLFYRVFNAHSHAAYPLRTDAFRLVSRRALNRAHDISANLPYRKAAYAACGLRMAELEFDGCLTVKKQDRFALATDSLVLYTDFGYRFSLGLTAFMACVTLAALVYTLVVWFSGNPVTGWTTTMFVLTFGLTGLFAILAILLKYLTLLVQLVFRRKNYLVESIEKL